MEINLSHLWDFSDPELSEQRFRDALASASSDDRFILQTQIARTYGLRGEFDRARQALSNIEPHIRETSVAGQIRYWIELGRTYCSATHGSESQTASAKRSATEYYLRGFELAQTSGFDGLAVDALHMMTMVENDPSGQVEWNRKAIAYMETSDQPEAKKWEGTLRNNLGYALHLAGNYEEALNEFQGALSAHEQNGATEPIRVAKWMIAWTLRAMGRLNEALEMQLQLEREWAEDGGEDPYVFDELEQIYRALGETENADHYAAKSQTMSDVPC